METPDTNYVADYETTIDESGNYTTIVTNAPGEGHRILVRKRWIDNSDVQHREPVTITAYYANDDNFEDDPALGSVTLGAPIEGTGQTGAWYDYISLQIEEIENFDLNKVYIRETAIGDQTDVDTDEDSNLEIPGNGGRVDNQITDRIDGEHHTYEVTYSIATLSPGQDGDGGDAGNAAGTQTFYVATNRRLGNIDITVTKEWKDGGALREALQKADIVPVVKLVVDTDKTNAEPPGENQNIEDIINYDTNEITLTNDKVPILNNEDKQATAIQRLLDENGKPVETLYFFNLPKYDKDGRVANYTVEELWTTQDNITNDKIIDPTKCVGEDDILKEIKDSALKELLAELLEDLTVTVTQESYTENDGNHINDDQQITITNKLSGTKSIEFHKQWNDTYAFDSGKRPDLYLTLYQLTGDNLITEYREYHWDKSLQTEEGEGGQQGQGEETEEPPQEGGTETQAQDNYYWTCIFENLPKYDENGNEIFYYAVENLAVTDPSTFHYAKPEFQYNNQEVEVEYGEDGTVALPGDDENVDDQTGQKILKVVGDKVALLENGTFLNNLEEDVSINGVKLWANLPLTASEADLPSVTFNVYQHSSDENGDSVENGTLVAQLAIEDWSKLPPEVNKSGNQYTFTIDEVTVDVEGLNKGDPLPLYDEDGRRYTYTLEEVLGTEGEGDTDDWNLVYHNETFNEYQITNTYDPQRGALNVKKLLEVEPYQEHYPSIRFRLYQVAPDSAGKYDEQNAVLYREESWSSEDVEKAIGNTPSVLTTEAQRVVVEETFTFKNLPIYAPNGEKYQYFVAEILDDGSGYEMNYEAAVKVGSYSTVDEVFQNGKTETTEIVTEEDGTEIITIALKTEPIEVTPNEDWDHENDGTVSTSLSVSNTFGDKYIPETISLTGTKVWNDQGNALGLRPEPGVFENYVKLYRYAEPQEGQYNGIGSSTSPILVENASFTWSGTDTDTWNYEITGLEQYAPNGMPWIYVVKEDMTGIGEDYIVSPPDATTTDNPHDARVEKPADEAENQVLELDPLTNSLTVTHTFTKNWENAGDDNLTWENIGVEEMKVTGTLYVGVMNENGTGLQEDSEMKLASEFFTESQWNEWFKNLGGLGEEEENYKFEKSQTIDVGTEGEIKFENLPLVQKNEDSSTSPLVYVVAETKVEFEAGENNYSQEFEPKFEVKNGSLTITYTPGNLMLGNEIVGKEFFTPQSQSIPLSSLANETVTESSAINVIGTTELTIKKIWNDNNDVEELRPESVDIVILQEKNDSQSGEESARAALFTSRQAPNQTTLSDIDNVVLEGNGHVKVVTLSQANNWSETIANLPGLGFDDKGNLITYKYTVRELREDWKEDAGAGVPMQDDLVDEANSKFNSYYTTFYDTEGETHTVTNTLTHMDITAVKEWKPEGLHGDYAEVTFTLQSRVVGSGDDAWKDVADADGKPVSKKLTGEEDPAWTVTWTELPRENDDGQTLEYKVLETLSEHFESDEDKKEPVEIIYPKDTITGGTAEKKYTVTNIPLGQITVTKRGGDGNGLAGVEFTLNSDSSTPMPLVGKTGEDGKLTFTELPLYDEQTGEPITYTLTESATPDGHIRLEQPIEVSFTAQEKPVDGIYWQTTDGFLLHEVAYEVVNGQYFQVVHTGGSGFYWPGVLGAGAAAAGVLYLIRRKTKGHNTEQ